MAKDDKRDDFDKLADAIKNDKGPYAAIIAVILLRRFFTTLERIATALEKRNG